MIEDLFTPTHLLILFAILFLLFGAKQLPGLGKSLGSGIREFRGGIAGLRADHDDELPESSTGEPLALTAAKEPPALTAADKPPVAADSGAAGTADEPPASASG